MGSAAATAAGGAGVCGSNADFSHPQHPTRTPSAVRRSMRQSIVFPLPEVRGQGSGVREEAWAIGRSGCAYGPRSESSLTPDPRPLTPVLSELTDEGSGRLGHQVLRQLDGQSSVSANRLHDLQQIPAVAGARAAVLAVVGVVQEVDRLRA